MDSEAIPTTVRPLGSRILRGALSGFVLSLLANAFLFASNVLIIPRVISVRDYADFTVSLTFVALSALVADLGMLHMHTRMFAEAEEDAGAGREDRRGRLFGSIVALRVLLALLVCALVLVIAPLFYPQSMVHNMTILLIILFISSRLLIVRAAGESLLRGRGKYYISSLFVLLDAVVFLILLLLPVHHSLEYVLWSYALCYLPGFCLLAGYIVRWMRRERIRLSVDLKLIRSMFRMALPLSLGTAFFTIYNEGDKLLLDKLSTPLEVSSFGAIIRISMGFALLPFVLGSVVAPELTRLLVRKDYPRSKQLVDLSSRVLLVFAGGIALLLTGCSDTLVTLLLGKSYAASGPALMWSGWLLVPFFFSSFLAEMTIAAGRFWLTLAYTAVIMVVAIATDLLLLSHYGAVGAAVARTIAVLIGGIVLVYFERHDPFLETRQLYRSLMKIVGSIGLGVLALAALASVHLGLWASVAGTLVCYILAIHFTHAMTFQEILALLNRIKRGGGEASVL